MIQNDARMTFTEHLAELRTRLIRSCAAILVAFIVAYMFHEQLFNIVSRPLKPLKNQGIITDDSAPGQPGEAAPAPGQPGEAAAAQDPPKEPSDTPEQAAGQDAKASEPPAATWTVLTPMEPFLVQLKLSFYAGLILAFPYVVYQLCAFIFPGLTVTERRLVNFLLIGSSFFVLFGVATAYFAVFPMVMPYLTTWVPADVTVQFRMSETVSLILKGMLGFAIAFQFPMVVMVLVYLDLLSPDTLRKYRRIMIVVLAVGSAAFTPPDPISMMAMLIPLSLLYEISIWAAVIITRRRKKAQAAAA